MRTLVRLLAFAGSLVSVLFLVLAAAVFGLFGTEDGRAFLQKASSGMVARLVGPEFQASLGTQTLDFLEDGSLAIAWSGASLTRTGSAGPVGTVRTVKAGIQLMPLLRGRVQLASLEIAGAEINVTGDRLPGRSGETPGSPPPETGSWSRARPLLPALSAGLLNGLQDELQAMLRLGLNDIRFSDITLVAPALRGTEPFTAKIDRADFSFRDPANLIVTASLRADDIVLPVQGTMRYDAKAGRLAAAAFAAGPLPLGTMVPPAPADDRVDTRPFASDSDAFLRFTLETRPEDGRRIGRARLSLGEGAVQAGRGHTRIKAAEVAFRYLEGEDAIVLDESRISSEGFATDLTGRLAPIYDRPDGGTFNGFDFALETTNLRSAVGLPEGVPPLTGTLTLAGRTDATAQEVLVSKAAFNTAEGRLSGRGALRFRTAEARSVFDLTAERLSAPTVKAFWPFNVASGARRWVIEHAGDEGEVSTGTIRLALARDRLTQAFKPDNHPEPAELDLAFDLRNVAVKTFGELPRLAALVGKVHTTGGDTRISIDAGHVDGFDGVALAPSFVSFVRAPPNPLHELDGSLSLAFSGGMPDLLGIAAREPVNALRALDIDPPDAAGHASGTVVVPFVLGDRLPHEHQIGPWTVALDLDRAGLKTPVAGHVLSDVSGPVTIVPGSATGTVKVKIDGIAAAVNFRQPFGVNPLGRQQFEVTATLSGDDLAERFPALAGVADGPIGARLVQDDGSSPKADIDLSGASLRLSSIGWRKGKGIAARIGFDVVADGGQTALKNLTVRGDGFAAEGEVVADAGGIRSAELQDVMLNPGDDVNVSLQRVDNGFSIRVAGARFDARPFLSDLKANLGSKATNHALSGKRQMDLGVAIDRLTGFGDKELRDFSLDLAGDATGVAALSLSGRSGRSEPFTVDISPRGSERSIRVRTPDAGSLADFAGLYGRMKRGALALDLVGSPEKGYRGTVAAENFTLVDEPRLSRLVGTAPSPSGKSLSKAIGTEIRTERAFFDHASAGIVYGKGGLQVSDGIIRGPDFGSSFSGTVYDPQNRIDIVGSFMPAYGLNRIFGAIPLVGPILGNGREGGLIGITYRLDGGFASPKLTVNPISAIAPGIFRNIFAYQ